MDVMIEIASTREDVKLVLETRQDDGQHLGTDNCWLRGLSGVRPAEQHIKSRSLHAWCPCLGEDSLERDPPADELELSAEGRIDLETALDETQDMRRDWRGRPVPEEQQADACQRECSAEFRECVRRVLQDRDERLEHKFSA